MKANRFWLEIIALCISIACALALLIASLGAAAGAASEPEPRQTTEPSQPQEQEEVYEGMITDTRCGAKHQAAIGKSAGDCTRVCVHGGAQFALIDGDKAYALEGDMPLLKRIAGRRSRIVGTLNRNTITVSAIAAEE